MTTKRTPKIFKEVVGEEEEEKTPDERADLEDRAMEEALNDFADGERLIKLYRYPGELGGRPRFLGGIAREDFNEIMIQERFGGGRYFGRWKMKSGQYKRVSFEIEGESNVTTRAQDREQQEGTQPYAYLGQAAQENEPAEKAAGSGVVSAIDLIRIMAETRRESREEMMMLLDRMKPAPQPPDVSTQVFALVEKIVPMIQSGGDGGNPWLQGIAAFKDPLMKIVDTIQMSIAKAPAVGVAPPRGPMIPPAALNKGAGVQPAQPAQPAPGAEVSQGEPDMIVQAFKPYLPMLVKASSLGADTGTYADMILDQVPRFAYDRLRTWLLKPGCLDALVALEPEIDSYRAWWAILREQLIEALTEELGDGVRSIQPSPDSNASASGTAVGTESS